MKREKLNAEQTPAPTPALVVFGTDEGDKPHASTFKPEEAELAAKAAGMMGMHMLHLTTAEHLALAAKLPVGRIFASGKGFVPFVGRALYEGLCGAASVSPNEPPTRVPAAKGSASRKAKSEPQSCERATAIEAIRPDSLVLACEGPSIGWFESIVVEAKPEDLFVLRWRDWPDMPQFVARQS